MIPIELKELTGHCERCPLNNSFAVYGYGPTGGLCIVGEAPAQNEVRLGKPFTGISGRLMRQLLTAVGVDPNTVRWTNAALCRPAGNKTPPISAISACNDRLFDEIRVVAPTKILALGSSALTALMGASKPQYITKWRGKGFNTYIDGSPVYTVGTYHPAAILRDPDLFRDAAADVQKLLSNDAPIPKPKVEAWIPTTTRETIEYLYELRSTGCDISCDLETTGFDSTVDSIISMGFGYCAPDNSGAAVIIGGNLIDNSNVRSSILSLLSTQITYHNAKFDLQFIERWAGQEFTNVDDTMLMNYTIDERPMGKFSTHSLKTLARIHLDAEDYAWNWNKYFADPDKFDIVELYKYQALDCYYTARLRKVLMTSMDDDARRLYGSLLRPGMHALRKLETTGVPIDIPYLKELDVSFSTQINEQRKELQNIVASITDLTDFNPNSPQQVNNVLIALGASLESTGKDILSAYANRLGEGSSVADIIYKILDYRNDSKLLQTYIRGFCQRASADDRIRGDFLLHGTVTGRLASRNPNLQNIPHHGGGGEEAGRRGDIIRKAFIASPGFTFFEADYSQLELRVAAYYSQDRVMRQTFIDGVDIHFQVASLMFGKPIEQITDQERHLAKYFDFGLVYGRGVKSLYEGREMDMIMKKTGKRWSLRDTENFNKGFMSGFPDLALWLDGQRRRAHTHHEVCTPTGRHRRFDLVLPDKLAERQAINSPIQGLSSDICLDALTRLQKILPYEEARIFFTVHDSIGGEIRTDLLHEYVPLIKTTMEDIRVVETDIPIVAEIKVGPNWAEAKEWKVAV